MNWTNNNLNVDFRPCWWGVLKPLHVLISLIKYCYNPCFAYEETGTDCLINLPNIGWLVNGGTGIRSWEILLPNLNFSYLIA